MGQGNKGRQKTAIKEKEEKGNINQGMEYQSKDEKYNNQSHKLVKKTVIHLVR